jgi:hypothetical protein
VIVAVRAFKFVTVTDLLAIGFAKFRSVARYVFKTYLVRVAPKTVEAPQLVIVIVPSPAEVTGEPGAVGLLNGVTAFDSTDRSEVKVEFLAVTLNVRDEVVERLLKVKDVFSVTRSCVPSSVSVQVMMHVT